MRLPFVYVEVDEVVRDANPFHAKFKQGRYNDKPNIWLHWSACRIGGDINSESKKVGAVGTPTDLTVALGTANTACDVEGSSYRVTNLLAQHGNPVVDSYIASFLLELVAEEVMGQLFIS